MSAHFRQLLEKKLNDPTFNEIYIEECSVCSFTLRIQKRWRELQFSEEQLKGKLDYNSGELQQLLLAEKCNPDFSFALAEILEVELPLECLKRGGFPEEKMGKS